MAADIPQPRDGADAPPPASDQCIKMPELARRLGLTSQVVGRLVRAGELPAPLLVGKSKRWLWPDVLAFLKERSRPQGAQPCPA